MLRKSIVPSSLLLAAVAACNSTPIAVTVSPGTANVLTCSTQTFTAGVAGSDDKLVSWSVTPSGVGSIDTNGKYTAPIMTPSPASASVTATSHADPTVKGSASMVLATAFPSAPLAIAGSTGQTAGVFPHSIAARGKRVYAAWPSSPAAKASLVVARSDDGGATFQPGVTAFAATQIGSQDSLDCASIAIDAADPDVVYVFGRVAAENDLGDAAAGGAGGVTSIFAVSTDGGTSFTPSVIQVGGTASSGWNQVGICGDVISPAPNTVVLESPGAYGNDSNPDIALWSDTNRGAGFATGTAADNDYVANGTSSALANLQGNHEIQLEQNGGTNDAGDATESPRLFANGVGRTCVVYYGTTIPQIGHTQAHAYVQCSDDAAKSFTKPLVIDPAQPMDKFISSPMAAFGPNHEAAVLWTNGISAAKLFIATSADDATTFGAPAAIPTYAVGGQMLAAMNPTVGYDDSGILWVAYRAYDGSSNERIVVDKSCDGGKTWSGAVLVNAPEPPTTNMRFPAFAFTPDAAPHIVATASDHLAYFSLTP